MLSRTVVSVSAVSSSSSTSPSRILCKVNPTIPKFLGLKGLSHNFTNCTTWNKNLNLSRKRNTRMESFKTKASAAAQPLKNADELIDSVETFIFDCDGVIWKGDKLIDGVPQTLDMLRSRGKRLVFVTNNSTKSRKQYGKKFETLGLDVSEEEIFASSFAAAAYLKSIDFPKDKKVYVVGEDGILKELELAGFQYLGGPEDGGKKIELKPGFLMEHDKDVGAVVVGFDRYFNYYKVQYGTLCIRENPGCLFIATNRDAVTHLTDAQEWAGGGSMVGAFVGSTQREPLVVGKPSTFMMDYLANKFGILKSQICMVGDRLDTDILFGQNGGCKTLLVLSGVTSLSMLQSPGNSIQPDFYTNKISDFLSLKAAAADFSSSLLHIRRFHFCKIQLTQGEDMIECSECHSKISANNNNSKAVARAYDRHRSDVSSKARVLNLLLVGGDCIFVGLQPILVYISKHNGNFDYSPISVNFLTETAKVFFAIFMLLIQARHKKVGEKSLLSFSTFVQAARNNVLLAVPAFLYAINNYLKFTMQLYFNPATVKMLSNLKVLVIAVLLKVIMKRRFSIIQWEALALLLIGISLNQLQSLPAGSTAMGLSVATGAYLYTLIFVTVPSFASVYNEYALKSQFETSIYLQNLFLYGYGAIFNFLAILVTALFKGPSSLDILHGHSKATMLLICNNAAQGILSSFFFKYADTILKKYSSTVATIFTGIASAVLFGHTLTMNFILGISIVFISMHQFFSPLSKVKDEPQNGSLETVDSQNNQRSKDSSFINMAAGANDDASHRVEHDEKAPLLPI
ncbi:hypothetical protein H0E87_019511 [Populus deltoides]|uniref:phosphoglycolate phosphatase n=1 Tax=Populus deltoides TaxID=3696 RepID=A0A8T2XVC1_POPDE|nr:hypothetical protein H0E87_019511 [Populus deltoides]